MVHKEETLVCPSVKYADQIAQCKQIHCKDCRDKEEKTNQKIEQLEKKLKVMTIVGAVAATAVGKDLLDKIVASFSNVAEAKAKIEEAANPTGANVAPQPSANTTSRLRGEQEQPLDSENPYYVNGNRSAYVTELDTPFAMDPSWDKPAPAYHEVNFVISTPKAVLAKESIYHLPMQEDSRIQNMGMVALAGRTIFTDYPMRSYVTDSPFGGYDGTNTGWNFNTFTVPAPATACLLLGAGLFRRRSR